MNTSYVWPRYVVLLVLFMAATARAGGQAWTLESSVRQAMQTAPELKKSLAQIGARKADTDLSGMWPDPSIELRVDNKLGKDNGSGGYDLTDVVISQPIPLSRMKYQKSAAEAKLVAAQYSRNYQALVVQNRVANVFHQLQLASAETALAEKRLQIADEMERQSRKNANGVVVRYLTPLEKMRLQILREEASQAAHSAEGKYTEALSEFARLLGIEPGRVSSVSPLLPVDNIPSLGTLLSALDKHAELASGQQQLIAATDEIDVARSSQLADPTVSLIRTRDTFGSGRENVYGIMVNVQIPLHDRKSAAVSKASYLASEKRIELGRIRRDLEIRLRRSYKHLNHVVEQAKAYRTKVLAPAAKMLELTRKGFSSGQLSMLNLVDANNTYFDARLNYLNLIYQARIESSDLRLYSGEMLVNVNGSVSSNNWGGQ